MERKQDGNKIQIGQTEKVYRAEKGLLCIKVEIALAPPRDFYPDVFAGFAAQDRCQAQATWTKTKIPVEGLDFVDRVLNLIVMEPCLFFLIIFSLNWPSGFPGIDQSSCVRAGLR